MLDPIPATAAGKHRDHDLHADGCGRRALVRRLAEEVERTVLLGEKAPVREPLDPREELRPGDLHLDVLQLASHPSLAQVGAVSTRQVEQGFGRHLLGSRESRELQQCAVLGRILLWTGEVHLRESSLGRRRLALPEPHLYRKHSLRLAPRVLAPPQVRPEVRQLDLQPQDVVVARQTGRVQRPRLLERALQSLDAVSGHACLFPCQKHVQVHEAHARRHPVSAAPDALRSQIT